MPHDWRRPDLLALPHHTRDDAPVRGAPGKQTLTAALPLPVQAKAAGGAQPATGTSGPTSGNSGSSGSSGGSAMPGEVRAKMERAFGMDFQGVRVRESESATSMGAVAYARGEEISFAPGRYDPHSEGGQRLLGHELAHVVQQREGRVAAPQGKGSPINADPALEAEADALGDRAARGEIVRTGAALPAVASTTVQRIKNKDYEPRKAKVDELENALEANRHDERWRREAIERLDRIARDLGQLDEGVDDDGKEDDRGFLLGARCKRLMHELEEAPQQRNANRDEVKDLFAKIGRQVGTLSGKGNTKLRKPETKPEKKIVRQKDDDDEENEKEKGPEKASERRSERRSQSLSAIGNVENEGKQEKKERASKHSSGKHDVAFPTGIDSWIQLLLDDSVDATHKLAMLCQLDPASLNALFVTIYSAPKICGPVLANLSSMSVLDLGPGGYGTTQGQTDATWWKLARIQIHAIEPKVGTAVDRAREELGPKTERYYPDGTKRDADAQFERQDHNDLQGLELVSIDKLLGEYKCPPQPMEVLGRTLIYGRPKGGACVCVKVAKPHEDTKELSKQAEMQEVLHALHESLQLQSATPVPLAVGKACLANHDKRIKIAIADAIVDHDTRFHRVFVYVIKSPDYLKYLNRTSDLSSDSPHPSRSKESSESSASGSQLPQLAECFDQGSGAALFDLCTLAGEGWLFTQLIDLYHGSADASLRDKRPEDGGRYAVLTNLLRSRYGLSGRLGGMGEVSAIEPAVEFPNWRKSGLADEGDSRSFQQIASRVKGLEKALTGNAVPKQELNPLHVEQPGGQTSEWYWENEDVKGAAQGIGLGYGKDTLTDPVWKETHHVKNLANGGAEHVDAMLMSVYLSEYLFSWLLTAATFYTNDPELRTSLEKEVKHARGKLDGGSPTLQFLCRSLRRGFVAAACGYTRMPAEVVDAQISAFIDFERMAKQIAFFMTGAFVSCFEDDADGDRTMRDIGLFPDDADVVGQDRMANPEINSNWVKGTGSVNQTATRKKKKTVHDLGASNGQMPLKEFEQAIYRLVPYLLLMRNAHREGGPGNKTEKI